MLRTCQLRRILRANTYESCYVYWHLTQSEHKEEEKPEHAENWCHKHLPDSSRVDVLTQLGGDVGIVDVIAVNHVFQNQIQQP